MRGKREADGQMGGRRANERTGGRVDRGRMGVGWADERTAHRIEADKRMGG